MAVQSSGALKASIAADLADNNAGNISAFDVRHNMEDIVDSMVPLARSGINLDNPFFGSVQVGLTGAGTGGTIMGFYQYFSEKNKHFQAHPVFPVNNSDGSHRIEGIGDSFK